MDILLCDDHQLLLDAMSSSLAAHGHRVVGTVTDPSAAAAAAERLQPDVCIVDIGFPTGSGIDAVRELMERVPGTKVLMLSASSDPVAIRESLEAGALGFARKEDSIDGVLEAISQLMRGEIAIAPRLLQSAMGKSAPSRSAQAGRPPSQLLTPREVEVLQLIVDGQGTNDIAAEMHIAKSTARSHIQSVLVKTGAHSRLQLATMAVRQGLVPART